MVQDIPNGVQGQQITYLLILRASYANSWADLTKVFNRIWNGPNWVNRVHGQRVDGATLGWPYRKLSQAEVTQMWEE